MSLSKHTQFWVPLFVTIFISYPLYNLGLEPLEWENSSHNMKLVFDPWIYVHLSILRKIIPFLLFQCIEKMSHANCPVCQEYLHTSPNPCHIPPCHHLVHKHCFEGLLSNGHYYCPTCSKSLLDLSPLWQIMQSQIEKSPMQGRYKVSSMKTTNRKYLLTIQHF